MARVAAVGVAGAAQGVVGQLGQVAESVKVRVNVPGENVTNPMPVAADLARLIDFRQGDGLKAHAGSLLPAHGCADCGQESAAIQKPAAIARPSWMSGLCFILIPFPVVGSFSIGVGRNW
jgi:hypothetical protein